MRILLLEDDKLFSETLEDFLSDENFEVDLAKDGEEALNLSFKNRYNLYLLDVNVPFINGFDFLKELRESGDLTPAIFITSLRDKESLSKGFDLGCDDFLRKPIDLDELLYRVNAILSRYNLKQNLIVIDENLKFDFKNLKLYSNRSTQNLAPKEALLLKLLIENRNSIVTREMIMDTLWSPSESISDGSIRVYINSLKKLIGKERIENIRGIGYRFLNKI